MHRELVQKIEAIFFYTAEPVSVSFLVKTLEVTKEDIGNAISELKTQCEARGLRLVEHNGEVSLVTAPEFSPLIEKIIKEERERDLGRAGIETLSIIAYKGPITKKEIEYIRGVNSQYALRNLLLRGLIDRRSMKDDERVVVYSVTSDTVRYLGLGSIDELPEYNEIHKQLDVVPEPEVESEAENSQ